MTTKAIDCNLRQDKNVMCHHCLMAKGDHPLGKCLIFASRLPCDS